jgi:site-specific DNA recombinase
VFICVILCTSCVRLSCIHIGQYRLIRRLNTDHGETFSTSKKVFDGQRRDPYSFFQKAIYKKVDYLIFRKLMLECMHISEYVYTKGGAMVRGSRRTAKKMQQVSTIAQAREAVSHRVVGYIRVSTDTQATDGYGLTVQERAIRAFAESQGYELLDVIVDAGVSGAIAPAKREGFARVLELAAAGEISTLIVYKFDRLSRVMTDAVLVANDLQSRLGVSLRSVTEPLDTASPIGRTLFGLLAGMAQAERDAITQRTLNGRKQKAREGGYACGRVPFGYRAVGDGNLTVDADQAATVRQIFSLRADGASLRQIVAQLNADRKVSARGGKWAPATVNNILDNPKYRGFVEYGFTFDGTEHVLEKSTFPAILAA